MGRASRTKTTAQRLTKAEGEHVALTRQLAEMKAFVRGGMADVLTTLQTLAQQVRRGERPSDDELDAIIASSTEILNRITRS